MTTHWKGCCHSDEIDVFDLGNDARAAARFAATTDIWKRSAAMDAWAGRRADEDVRSISPGRSAEAWRDFGLRVSCRTQHLRRQVRAG